MRKANKAERRILQFNLRSDTTTPDVYTVMEVHFLI